MTPFFGSLFTRRGLQAMGRREGSRGRRRRLRESMPLSAQRLEDRLPFAVTPTSISAVADDAGAVKGAIAINGLTDDSTPTLSGKAQAGSTVTVFDGNTNLGTTTADTKGGWTFTPAALTDGLHTFKAKADGSGATGALSSGYAITTDTVAPTAAVTAVPSAKTYTAGQKLSFTVTLSETVNVTLGSGKTPAPPTLGVTIGSNVRQAVYASGSGTKSLVFNYTVAAGDATASATPISLASAMTLPTDASIRDAAGNNVAPTFTSTPSLTGVLVDAVAPTAAFESLPAARTTALASVGVSFNESVTGVTLGSFKLTRDNAPVTISTATLTGSGASYTLGGLGGFTDKSGVYKLSLEATGIADAAGNKMPQAKVITWANDTTPPAAPAIKLATDDAGGLKGTVAANGVTDDATPTLSGTAEANSTVTVFDGTTSLGTTSADSKGAWSFTPTTALTDGSHTFTAKATDPAGNTGVLSSGLTITTDSRAPTAAVTGVPAAQTYGAGGKLSFTVTFVETVTVAGKAPALPSVGVTIGSAVRQAVYASGSGSKTLVFDYTVAAGDSTAANAPISLASAMTVPTGASIRDAAGNDARPSFTSTASLAGIFVDAAGPTPTFDSLPEFRNTKVASVGIKFNESATGVKLESFKLTRDNAPVTITTATLTGSGASYTLGGLGGFTDKSGVYKLSLEAGGITDSAGNKMSAAKVITWTTDATPPAAPVIAAATDDVGAVKGTIATNGVTDDPTPTLSGTAEANSTVEVFEGDASQGTTKADSNGAWSLKLDDVADGPHTYTAKATDLAGNTSVLSSGRTLTVNATRATPAVTGVPTAKTYGPEAYLRFTVTFSEAVKVTLGIGDNPPTLDVNIGDGVRTAYYVSGSGTSKLVFECQTQAGDATAAGSTISLADSIFLPEGAKIRNNDGVSTSLKFTSIASLEGIFVDALSPTATFENVGSVRKTPVSSITITFNESVRSAAVQPPSVGDLSVKNFTLFRGATEVSLSNATLTKSGNTYTLSNLTALQTVVGSYRLSVGGLRRIPNDNTYVVTDLAGNVMDQQQGVSWQWAP